MTIPTLKKKLILQAFSILKCISKLHNEDSSRKKSLLETTEAVYLQVNLKEIPESGAIKMIKAKLPHSPFKDTPEVCLITGDLNKNNRKAEIEPDILHYKALLEKHDVTQISQIITLRQLRTEYKPYEAKQKLLAAYDLFIADNKIAHCLPKVLGKHFFKKRKFPIQVNMKTENLKLQIEKALSTKMFYVTGLGNTCVAEVAYLDMNNSEIVDNVIRMAQELYKELPGSWDNVMGMYLKTAKSKAIPIYISYDKPQGQKEFLKRKKNMESLIQNSDELDEYPVSKKRKIGRGINTLGKNFTKISFEDRKKNLEKEV